MYRVGVDIGGTFTDLVVLDEATGELKRTKTLTTPHAPEDGFLNAVEAAQIRLDEISRFLHGTTLVTNLIIERSGAKLGLITTEGFRDVLEIQRSYRDDLYNLQWDKPKALVPACGRSILGRGITGGAWPAVAGILALLAELVIEKPSFGLHRGGLTR